VFRSRQRSLSASLIAAVFLASTVSVSRVGLLAAVRFRPDIPQWWRNTRAFYCPWENSGAGASLMQFKAHRDRGFESFTDLDKILEDARRLGTNVLYLVGYWEPDYEHKAEYGPNSSGAATAPSARGWTRSIDLGAESSSTWRRSLSLVIRTSAETRAGMGDDGRAGRYYSYQGTGNRFYLMYRGRAQAGPTTSSGLPAVWPETSG